MQYFIMEEIPRYLNVSKIISLIQTFNLKVMSEIVTKNNRLLT